ncbi:MAG: hypothetical protein ACKOXB_03235 [Flavobacteriales bacterium]
MPKPFSIQLSAFIQQLNTLPVSQLYKLDSILSDLANHVYDIGEYTSDLLEGADAFDIEQKSKTLQEIVDLEKELISLSDILYKMDYDSHYMDRTQHTLAGVFDDVEELKGTLVK